MPNVKYEAKSEALIRATEEKDRKTGIGLLGVFRNF
jgi:hypothetical protein